VANAVARNFKNFFPAHRPALSLVEKCLRRGCNFRAGPVGEKKFAEILTRSPGVCSESRNYKTQLHLQSVFGQSHCMASKAKSSKKPSAAQLAARKRFAEMARARAAGKGKPSKPSTKKGGNKSRGRARKRDVREDKGSKRVPSLATKPISSPKGSGEVSGYSTGQRSNRPKAIQPKRVRNPYFGAIGVSATNTPMFIDYWA